MNLVGHMGRPPFPSPLLGENDHETRKTLLLDAHGGLHGQLHGVADRPGLIDPDRPGCAFGGIGQRGFARSDVVAQLEELGVSPEDAQSRVAALTDEEALLLADQIENAPAGGIIGAILLVFFVLLITDILGFTKVFPFTRSVK
jgi:hypothetical protein